MRHRKTPKADSSPYGALKVDRDVRDAINTAAREQGMTTAGAFRRFRGQIISVIKQEQPAAATAGAA